MFAFTSCGQLEDLIDHTGGKDTIGEEINAAILSAVDTSLGGGETSSAGTTAAAAFNLSGASSTGGTSLSATFSEAPGDGATTLSNYCVTITSVATFSQCQSSPGVLVLSGTPAQSDTTVTITTATQTASVYVLWVQNVTSSEGNALAISSASFIGSGSAAFNVTGATSGSSSQVRVNFSNTPDTAHTTLGNYCVSTVNHASFAACDADTGNKLTISGTPSLSGSQISITSATQSAITYYVWVQNVMSSGLGLTVAQASFTGQVPTPFNVDSASGVSSTVATVTYSEAPNATQAQATSNYCLTVNVVADFATCSGGSTLSVSSAVLSGSTVTLTTASQLGVTYYVWVQNVTSDANATALTTDNTNFSGTAPGPLTGLVINEIGFNSSSDWFVEIHNTTTLPIDLGAGGARLRRDANCSLPNITTSITLSGTVLGNDYFTVVRGATFAGSADQTVTSGSLDADDCLAITDNASTISASNASNVIDFLGFGGSPAYEGTSAALGWRNLARCANGTDTDQNGTDFTSRSDALRTPDAANNCTAATAFNVTNAVSNSDTQITVTYSAAPYQSYAEVQGNYCVTSNTSNTTFAACTGDTGNLLALSGTPSLTGSDVTITTASQIATNYKVFVQNVLSDTEGTPLTTDNFTFTGTAPVVNATLVINEVATAETNDLIELYVTGSGNLLGLQVYERNTSLITLPNVTVTAGDYIVIHLGAGGGETNETTSITESSDAGHYTTAWDYWSTDGGLTGTDGNITIRDSSGTTIIDALLYANNNGSWTGEASSEGTTIVGAGQWDASGLESDAVNVDDTTGNSYQNRVNGSSSNNEAGAWRVGTSSFGAANEITGAITLDGTNYYTTGATAVVTVTDDDLNTNTGSVQTVNITATSTSDGTGISLTLTETGVNTGVFTSTATGSDLAFCNTGSCSSSPTLEVSDGDTVTVSYADAAPAGTRTDTATWNVSAPANNTATYVVISEVCYEDCGGSGTDFEFIELYNPTASAIDLCAGGYRIERDTDTGDPSFIFTFGTGTHGTFNTCTIPARGFYLIVNENNTGLTADAEILDSRLTLAADDVIYLGTGTISGPADPDIVDFVGIQTTDFEGASAAPAMAAGQSVERKAYVSSTADTNGTTGMYTGGGHASNGNAEDANNNGADWILRTTPDPQNSGSSTETP